MTDGPPRWMMILTGCGRIYSNIAYKMGPHSDQGQETIPCVVGVRHERNPRRSATTFRVYYVHHLTLIPAGITFLPGRPEAMWRRSISYFTLSFRSIFLAHPPHKPIRHDKQCR